MKTYILKHTILATAVVLLLQSCGIQKQQPLQAVDLSKTQGPGIEFGPQKVYSFKKQGVYFSSKFPSARLNDVEMINDSTFRLTVKPENSPINPSPWYAFQIWSQGKKSRNLYLELDYQHVKHRYAPLIKKENQNWEEISGLELSKEKNEAKFVVQTTKNKAFISAQPLFNADSIRHWLKKLDRKSDVEVQEIGKSLLQYPIFGYQTPVTHSKKAILIFGGQHPPEITGYQAQLAFVNFILGDHPEAKRFRTEYQIIGVPWINPDGNNLGHWRHNVAGVDLNRDWTNFLNPETQAARDFVNGFKDDQHIQFVFGIDFHSTYRDVLYTNLEDSNHPTHMPGLMNEWITNWQNLLQKKGMEPDFSTIKVEPSKASGRVSKSWFLTDLQAESVTYEVADETPFEIIHEKAEQAALALIQTLMKK